MKKLTETLFCPLCVLLLLLASLNSCSSKDDEDETPEAPKQEDTSVVVTGPVVETGITYARMTGNVYLDRVPAAMMASSEPSSLKVGVELSAKKDFSSGKTSLLMADGLEGSTLTVAVDTLSAHTTYYYRVFFRIGNFSLYGEKQSFTTEDFESPVLTDNVDDITFTSAKVSYSIPDVQLAEWETIASAVAYSTDRNSISPDKVRYVLNTYEEQSAVPDGVHFSFGSLWSGLKGNVGCEILDNLQPDCTYYYCLVTAAGSSLKFSEVRSFKTLSVDGSLLSTGAASDITFATATVTGSVQVGTISQLYNGQAQVYCGICYAPESEYTASQIPSEALFPDELVLSEVKDGPFTMELLGLSPETSYVYRTFIRIDQAVLVGEVKRFVTKATKDYLSIDVSDIGFSTASFKGKTQIPNAVRDVRYRLSYMTTAFGNPWGENQTTPTLNGEDITATLDGLSIGATYEYWLTATIGGKDYQSEKKSFATLNPSDYIVADEPSGITSSSVVISGYLDPKAYETENFCFIYYGTDKNNLFQQTTASVVNDRFRQELKNLRSNTTYYYHIGALCHLGVGYADWFYSETKSFTTLP